MITYFLTIFVVTFIAVLAANVTSAGLGLAYYNNVYDPHHPERVWTVGDMVVAHEDIADDDNLYASLGDFGTVIYVDGDDNVPTVAFARSQMATIVGNAEVLRVVTS